MNTIRIVEHPDRGPLALVAFTDLDGTANDETLPEEQRIDSIGPARQCLARLRAIGIPAGPITSRSLGEASWYAQHLQCTGPLIAEDGAVIDLPLQSAERVTTPVLPNVRISQEGNQLLIVTSRVTRGLLEEFAQAVRRALGPGIVSTVEATPELLRARCGHGSVEEAARSADRLASAYFVVENDMQRQKIIALAQTFRLRAFGDVVNVIGSDTDKARGLAVTDKLAHFIHPRARGIAPIVFGNGRNDAESLTAAAELGGFGVLVGQPGGGFAVDEHQFTNAIIRSPAPNGHGMLDALPAVHRGLQDRYSVRVS